MTVAKDTTCPISETFLAGFLSSELYINLKQITEISQFPKIQSEQRLSALTVSLRMKIPGL